MYTKQEKLAAARKKLKEFQGKQRENELNRAKTTPSPASYFKESTSKSSTVSPCSSSDSFSVKLDTPNILERANSNVDQPYNTVQTNLLPTVESIFSFDLQKQCGQEFPSYVVTENKTGSDFFSNIENQNSRSAQGYQNGMCASEIVSCNKTELYSGPENSISDTRPEVCNFFKDSQCTYPTEVEYNQTVQSSQSNQFANDPRNFFVTNFSSNNIIKDDINTDRTSILQVVEEKNNLLQVLKRTEELLKLKTDQEQSMAQSVTFLQTRVKELEGRILNFESEVHDLKSDNVQLIKQKTTDDTMMDQLQKKVDSREEQFAEMQQKLDLKTKECQFLSFKLNEAQNQLSSSMIKIQQLSVGESPAFSAKVNDLQNENSNLTHKIQDLEKSIQFLNKEKEESSLNFHNYAQQCNSQLSTLSSQVQNMTKENVLLKEKNEDLEKKLQELESVKNESSLQQDQPVVTELTNKLDELTKESRLLKDQLQEKVQEIELLQKEKAEKAQEVDKMYSALQEMRSENLKLMEEREGANSNQKLLAAMESDKVAAARAVSQNQKLKDQVVELEDAFVKLSDEKLQLTDELAYERHMRKELELKLKEMESDQHCHDDHKHKTESTINEGEDIEELKNIIRQLENDKTELLSRLNARNSALVISTENVEDVKHNNHDHDHYDQDHHHDHGHDHVHDSENNTESDCCKRILKQMEEKVKKTMNEIAALDEEKEKLEHLVMQLQGETETIGEYISLYQTQRMLLRQRNQEKDDQLLQLSKDKEELKTKLSTLNELINHLITEKGIDGARLAEFNNSTAVNRDSEVASKDTAEKIQALICDIQSTNLINNQSVAFEHCPCCSGRLIVI